MQAIEKRFGGNTETKKVQKTLLKQQFKNFTSSSSENLDQIHDRLQNLVSQLKIHEAKLDAAGYCCWIVLLRSLMLLSQEKSVSANQSTSLQLDNEDLKQIDVDDLEEIDLR
nr:ribonuclease H-like domain-containing protein [Tanacetum cinerariifolium]